MGTIINLAAQTDQSLPSVRIPAGGSAGYVWTLVNPLTGAGAWMAPSTPTPPPPPVGAIVWLKADTGVFSDAGITPSVNNGPVSQWSDQSGNGNNLNVSGDFPTFKTNIVNGNPVVRFDGIDDVLDSALIGPLAQPNTIFIVFDFKTGTFIFDNVNGGAGRGDTFGFDIIVVGNISITANGGVNAINFARSTPTGFVMYQNVFNGGSSEMFQNGTLVASGSAGALPIDGLRLGKGSLGSPFGEVDIAEIMVYNSILSAGDQSAVTTYLNNKYNL